MCIEFNLTELSPKEKMKIWIMRGGMSFAQIAKKMEMTAGGVSRLFNSATIPTERHTQLVKLGIPLEFIPTGCDIPTGPKPTKNLSVAAPQQPQA